VAYQSFYGNMRDAVGSGADFGKDDEWVGNSVNP
jgi:hypothetical protein